jgi:hypothetical protein
MALLEVHGPGHPLVRVTSATPSDVSDALESLDGTRDLYLSVAEPVWLGIAAGPDRFFLAWTDDGESCIYQAVASEPGPEHGEFIVGGQKTSLAPEYLVAKADALQAALHFLATGDRSPVVEWRRM